MKHSVFLTTILLLFTFLLHGQTQSVRINVTPTAYIKNSVDQKMEKWLQKDPYESAREYEIRVSKENKTAARNRFETEAIAKYKELFTNNVNWGDMRILRYNNTDQEFLIQSSVCADFTMPVPRASSREFETGFSAFKKTNPDFYFEGDVVKISKLTFSDSRGKSYIYDITNTGATADISWLSPLSSTSETNRKDLLIQACICSESQIISVSVVVNEQLTRGVSAVVNDGCDYTINQTIALIQGMNTVKIVVENKAGQSVSDIRYVNYEPSINPNPNSYPVSEVTPTNTKRLALVMGNAAYQTSPLANPVNDATDMSARLKKLGFDVFLQINRTKEQMDRAIDEFGQRAKGYDVALFFYAGHAIQYNGKNYLMPVNVDLQQERDIEFDCTSIDRALARMEDANTRLKIILLDACRNNPFERSWRGIGGNGLSFMDAPAGTFIAYSTAPNTVALDGKGRNSPYVTELLKNLSIKHLKIEDLFKQVREAVMKKTDGKQVPWDQSSITGEFYFNY